MSSVTDVENWQMKNFGKMMKRSPKRKQLTPDSLR